MADESRPTGSKRGPPRANTEDGELRHFSGEGRGRGGPRGRGRGDFRGGPGGTSVVVEAQFVSGARPPAVRGRPSGDLLPVPIRAGAKVRPWKGPGQPPRGVKRPNWEPEGGGRQIKAEKAKKLNLPKTAEGGVDNSIEEIDGEVDGPVGEHANIEETEERGEFGARGGGGRDGGSPSDDDISMISSVASLQPLEDEPSDDDLAPHGENGVE